MHHWRRQTWIWRACCALLAVVAVVPEVRCCCDLSWGPAGMVRPAFRMEAAAKPKCTCCRRKSEYTESPAAAVDAVPDELCDCQLHVTAGSPSSSSFSDLVPAVELGPIQCFDAWSFGSINHIGRATHPTDSRQLWPDTALEVRAVLASWQI
jgi:hypothetical protein